MTLEPAGILPVPSHAGHVSNYCLRTVPTIVPYYPLLMYLSRPFNGQSVPRMRKQVNTMQYNNTAVSLHGHQTPEVCAESYKRIFLSASQF